VDKGIESGVIMVIAFSLLSEATRALDRLQSNRSAKQETLKNKHDFQQQCSEKVKVISTIENNVGKQLTSLQRPFFKQDAL